MKLKQLVFIFTVALLFFAKINAAPAVTTEFIKIDQFGYKNNDQKIAVISDPIIGYNAALSFTPGSIYQIRDWFTNAVLFTGAPIAWNGGATHSQSGDRVWYFDFSSVTTTGSYYVFDVTNDVGSYRFEINDCVYNEVLKIACRANYYQRCGSSKAIPFADANWTDTACHIGANQDLDCRLWSDPTNVSLSRNLPGGWHDAGDYNKYVNFAWNPVLDLLLAYEEHPSVWLDNYNIPESGNGIPDVLDDVKYELDWLLKMQQTNGSVLCIVGTNNYQSTSPPSAGGFHRFYGPATTQATFAAAGMFALASIEFNSIGQTTYANQLQTAAINAWNWAVANPNIIFHNNNQNSAIGPINYLAAGDQEGGWSGFVDYKQLVAAVYLYAATGNTIYKNHVDSNYNIVPFFVGVDTNDLTQTDALLYYTKTVGATTAVKNDIISQYSNSIQTGVNNLPSYLNQTDAYRAYICNYNWNLSVPQYESTYDWGSNTHKGHQGTLFLNMNQYSLNPVNASNYTNAASGFLHYFHGVNPNSKTFLSNMVSFGAENSIQSFYHAWFDDGTIYDTNPAPGFTVMGANEMYETYTCCALNCETNCSEVANLMNDPAQKCYKDFNSGYPFASWTVTENQIYTQAAYIRLLSKFCTTSCSSLAVNENDLETIKFQISPNPSSDYITIQFSDLDKKTIEIYNSIGQLVSEVDVANNSKIDISNLSNGVYFIKMKGSLNQSIKFIKE